MDDLLQFPHITSILETYAEELRKLYRENLVKSDALATEQLYNTATYQVTRDGLTWEVSLSLQDYWKYVEEGTKPHWTPTEAITKWVRVKPVIPRPDAFGRIPSEKSLVYLIRRKIAREGTEGRHDLLNAVQECNRRFLRDLETACQLDIDNLASVAIQPLADKPL